VGGKEAWGGMFEQLDVIQAEEPLDGPMQMALDEVLLSRVTLPTLRVYRWSSRWVTFGYFQREGMVRNLHPDYPAVRRWTGGGVVVHDGDFTFSLIIPANAPAAGLSPAVFYQQLHGALGRFLGGRLAAEGDLLEGPSCFQSPSRDDVLLDGEKILGGAIRRSRGALLYQGSLRWPTALGGEAFNTSGRVARELAKEVYFRGISPEERELATQLASCKYRTIAWIGMR